MSFKFADTLNENAALWASMTYTRKPAVFDAARRIIANKTRYQEIERATNVPWYVVGVIHMRESNLRFDCHLHNGDPLNRRTYRVPANRPTSHDGPFTFEESAIDALTAPDKALDKISMWTLPRIAFEIERYNGFGYRYRNRPSPYLWAGSQHYRVGKFVRDGVYDPTTTDSQLGCMPVLKAITELDKSVEIGVTHPSTESQASTVDVTRKLAKSRTVMGAMIAAIGELFGSWMPGAVDLADALPDAADKAASLQGALTTLFKVAAINAPQIGGLIVFVGVALVLYARIDAARNNKEG